MKNPAYPLLLASLLLGACAGAPAEPATFEEWLATLPEPAGFHPYHADFQVHSEMDLLAMGEQIEGLEVEQTDDHPADGLRMRLSMRGEIDYAAADTARANLEMFMDFPGLTGAGGPSEMDLGLLCVSDGSMLWIEPAWRSDWLSDAMAESGGQFENMTFTAKLDTVRRLLENYGVAMDAMAPGLFGDLKYMELMERSLDISFWPRLLGEGFGDIDAFEVVGDEVRLEFGLSEEYLEVVRSMEGAEMMGDFHYTMTAERATGIVREVRFMTSGAMSMDMSMVVTPHDLGDWPDGHFRYELPRGRSKLPIDMYLDLLGNVLMQSFDVAADDMEF